MLDSLSPADPLDLEVQTRQLFSRAVACLKNSPPEGVADLHALDVSLSADPYPFPLGVA